MPQSDQQTGQSEPIGQVEQLLIGAVNRRAPIVLSLPTDGMVRHFRTRLLCENEDGIWIELVTAADAQLQELIASQNLVAGSFNAASNRVTFLSTVAKVDPTFRVDEKTALPAVCLRRPSDFRVILRRGTYRVRVTPESGLQVSLWRIAEDAKLSEQPAELQRIQASVSDISTGGIGIQLLADDSGERPGIVAGSRMRCEIALGQTKVLLQGRLRVEPVPADSKDANAGVMFDNLEIDVQGRQTLDMLSKIIDELQGERLDRSGDTAA